MARGFRADSEQHCWDLVTLLLQADERLRQGRAGLDWERLADGSQQGGGQTVQTWGPQGPRPQIEVGSFRSHGDGSETKTGHRFARPLPVEWVSRYRLDEREHPRRHGAVLQQR